MRLPLNPFFFLALCWFSVACSLFWEVLAPPGVFFPPVLRVGWPCGHRLPTSSALAFWCHALGVLAWACVSFRVHLGFRPLPFLKAFSALTLTPNFLFASRKR